MYAHLFSLSESQRHPDSAGWQRQLEPLEGMRWTRRDQQQTHRPGSPESQTNFLSLSLHLLRVGRQQELCAVKTQGGRVCGRTNKRNFFIMVPVQEFEVGCEVAWWVKKARVERERKR